MQNTLNISCVVNANVLRNQKLLLGHIHKKSVERHLTILKFTRSCFAWLIRKLFYSYHNIKIANCSYGLGSAQSKQTFQRSLSLHTGLVCTTLLAQWRHPQLKRRLTLQVCYRAIDPHF